MKIGADGRWSRFGIAVWVIGIALLVAGFILSQQRETKDVLKCLEYSGVNCAHSDYVKVTTVPALAIVGYFLAAFGALFIFSGFIVYFILTSRSKKQMAGVGFTGDSMPSVEEPKR